MSFSSEVKKELCGVPVVRECCARAEAYGAMLNGSSFSHLGIRLSTSEPEIAGRIKLLLIKAFSVECEPAASGRKWQLVIEGQESVSKIFDALGYDLKSHVSYHINRNVIEDECCMASYLRGMFLMSGTVAGPGKKSHLEIRPSKKGLSGEETSLLLDLGFSPKSAKRENAYVLYFKDSASIEALLNTIGATASALRLTEAKAEKKLRNKVNRQVNCEAANLAKSANAAARQTELIMKAIEAHGETAFPETLMETVRLRLEYPDDTLSELASKFDPPISKPGLSHRLKKITELAESLTNQG